MAELRGSETEANLRRALALEATANRRYLYFAQQADAEGHHDIAELFRSVADGETAHAFGHLDLLAPADDAGGADGPARDATTANLRAAVDAETHEGDEVYPAFARTARAEGFDEIAEWLETLARAERSHAVRFQQGLDGLR